MTTVEVGTATSLPRPTTVTENPCPVSQYASTGPATLLAPEMRIRMSTPP